MQNSLKYKKVTTPNLLIVAVVLFSNLLYSQSAYQQKIIYNVTPPYEVFRAFGVCSTSDSGKILTGYVPSENSYKATLIKLNKFGLVSWQKSYGQSTGQNLSVGGQKVLETPDKGYLMMGGFSDWDRRFPNNGGGYFVKTDSVGSMQWAKKIGGTINEDVLNDIQPTSDGGYICVGATASYGTKGNVPPLSFLLNKPLDVWLIKLNALGNILWTKTFGNADLFEQGYSVKQTLEGGYVICGSAQMAPQKHNSDNQFGILLKTDDKGILQWQKKYDMVSNRDSLHSGGSLTSLQLTADSGFIITGVYNDNISNIGGNVLGNFSIKTSLLKADKNGDITWLKVYTVENAFEQTAQAALYLTNDGGYSLATQVSGRPVLLKTDGFGMPLWSKMYGSYFDGLGGAPAQYRSMVMDYDKGYFIVGDIYNNKVGQKEGVMLTKTDTSGNVGSCQTDILVTVKSYTTSVSTWANTTGAGGSFTTTGSEGTFVITDTIGCFGTGVTANFYTEKRCTSDSTLFVNSSTGIQFNWNFGDVGSGTKNFSLLQSPKHKYDIAGSYTVTLIANDANSSDTSRQIVNIDSQGFMTVSVNVTICSGNAVSLNVSGDMVWQYWEPGSIYEDTIVVAPNATTTYKVFGSNVACLDEDSVTVTVIPSITVSISNAHTICNGGSFILNVTGGNNYLWSTGDVDSTITVNPIISTTYSVIASSGFCVDTVTTSVAVLAKPVLNLGNNITIDYGSSCQLSVNEKGTYLWTPQEGLSCNSCSEPIVTPKITTEYIITLTDINGCSVNDSVIVFVNVPCQEGVFIPNAFSPNNDGQNDMVCVSINSCIQTFRFLIYDRWGNKVFEASNVEKSCWDGTFKNLPMSNAVFVYYLSTSLSSGEVLNQKGNISLLR